MQYATMTVDANLPYIPETGSAVYVCSNMP